MQIAVEGCCHGELDNIYGTLQHLEKAEWKKIDLLISCGDFQAGVLSGSSGLQVERRSSSCCRRRCGTWTISRPWPAPQSIAS